MISATQQLYGSREAYQLPVYSLRQAAHLTGLATTTVRAWTQVGDTQLVQPAGKSGLSFLNLVELHMLAAIRKQHHVSLGRVRQAVEYVRQTSGSAHPLAEQEFETDGVDLFIRALDSNEDETLINASRRGQVAIREFLNAYLKRIERAPDGFPLRLFPLYQSGIDTIREVQQAPQHIFVDPAVAFGRPVLAQGFVPVDVVVGRYRAGDSMQELVEDYSLSLQAVEEAIRYELGNAA